MGVSLVGVVLSGDGCLFGLVLVCCGFVGCGVCCCVWFVVMGIVWLWMEFSLFLE